MLVYKFITLSYLK